MSRSEGAVTWQRAGLWPGADRALLSLQLHAFVCRAAVAPKPAASSPRPFEWLLEDCVRHSVQWLITTEILSQIILFRNFIFPYFSSQFAKPSEEVLWEEEEILWQTGTTGSQSLVCAVFSLSAPSRNNSLLIWYSFVLWYCQNEWN